MEKPNPCTTTTAEPQGFPPPWGGGSNQLLPDLPPPAESSRHNWPPNLGSNPPPGPLAALPFCSLKAGQQTPAVLETSGGAAPALPTALPSLCRAQSGSFLRAQFSTKNRNQLLATTANFPLSNLWACSQSVLLTETTPFPSGGHPFPNQRSSPHGRQAVCPQIGAFVLPHSSHTHELPEALGGLANAN